MTRKYKKPKIKPLKYFFYHGDLCKKIHIHRPNDIVTAWNYPKGKAEKYVYSDVRKNGAVAFSTSQVQTMVNRSYRTLMTAIHTGAVRKPQMSYGIDENRNTYGHFWSEDEVVELWKYLGTVHYGRPRKDGMVTSKPLPTLRELRAMMRQGTVFYVKVGDEFVPTWQAN